MAAGAPAADPSTPVAPPSPARPPAVLQPSASVSSIALQVEADGSSSKTSTDSTVTVDNLITQVTRADENEPAKPHKHRRHRPSRIRQILCCIAPPPPVTSRLAMQPVLQPPPPPPKPIIDPALIQPPAVASPLLGGKHHSDNGKKCLVLDLDETLVHSTFKPVPRPDYIIPVELEGTVHHVYVVKRPGCDEFLAAMQEFFEVVVFTASLSKYANPLLDQLDKTRTIRGRLYREACVMYQGKYVKDLSMMGRELHHTIIVDNSPMSFMFQPENAIHVTSFIDDPHDRELFDLRLFLETLAKSECADVRTVLPIWKSRH